MNISLDSKIDKLDLKSEYVELLNQKGIFLVKDLWVKSKKDLKNLNLSEEQIKYLRVKLQLWSLDLDQKMYDLN